MRRVFDVAAARVLRRLRHRLADRSLQFVWIGLGFGSIEIEVLCRLIHAVKILQIRECDQPAVAETVGLVWGELSRNTRGRKQRRAEESDEEKKLGQPGRVDPLCDAASI